MRKILAIICTVTLMFSIAACGSDSGSEPSRDVRENNVGITTADTQSEMITDAETTAAPVEQPESQTTEEEEDMQRLIIEVGDKSFTATLYDNETVIALTEMLPLTLNMSELNGNEKYYYLDDTLPTDSERPSGIKEGDIMLYGNSCLVLFYESFSTSYSYTPIGHIDDPSGLAQALGKKSVEVTFRLN